MTLSSLRSFGLTRNATKGETSLTDLSREILFAESEDEKLHALRRSATNPKVFKLISEKFGYAVQNTDGVIAFLRKNAFTEVAAKRAAKSYLETIRYALLTEDAKRFDEEGENDKNSYTPSQQQEPEVVDSSIVKPENFQDWIRYPLDSSLTVRIMTNGKQDIPAKRLKELIELLKVKLNSMDEDEDLPAAA